LKTDDFVCGVMSHIPHPLHTTYSAQNHPPPPAAAAAPNKKKVCAHRERRRNGHPRGPLLVPVRPRRGDVCRLHRVILIPPRPPARVRGAGAGAGGGGIVCVFACSVCLQGACGVAEYCQDLSPSAQAQLKPRPPPPTRPPHQQGQFAKAVACLLPLGLATYITMSRVAGYKHDFSDVNCGETHL
jgi:hypothetical protein